MTPQPVSKTEVKVWVYDGEANTMEIRRGMDHKCCLFNLYGLWLAKAALEGMENFKMLGRLIETII